MFWLGKFKIGLSKRANISLFKNEYVYSLEILFHGFLFCKKFFWTLLFLLDDKDIFVEWVRVSLVAQSVSQSCSSKKNIKNLIKNFCFVVRKIEKLLAGFCFGRLWEIFWNLRFGRSKNLRIFRLYDLSSNNLGF